MSDIEDLNEAIFVNNRSLGEDGLWARMSNEALNGTQHVSSNLVGIIGSSNGVEFELGDIEDKVVDYKREVGARHAAATEALRQGHQRLQALLEGTNNQYALRGLQELVEAYKASQRVDERVQAVTETLILEVVLRMQDLVEALGAAANQVFVPFISDAELGNISNITTDDARDTGYNATGNAVSRPLYEGHKLIDNYRRGPLLGMEDAR